MITGSTKNPYPALGDFLYIVCFASIFFHSLSTFNHLSAQCQRFHFMRDKLTRVPDNVYWIGLNPVSLFFTGRRAILQTLRETLCSDDESPEQSEHTRFVIYGMGGAGKSEICLKFAHENREQQVFLLNEVTP